MRKYKNFFHSGYFSSSKSFFMKHKKNMWLKGSISTNIRHFLNFGTRKSHFLRHKKFFGGCFFFYFFELRLKSVLGGFISYNSKIASWNHYHRFPDTLFRLPGDNTMHLYIMLVIWDWPFRGNSGFTLQLDGLNSLTTFWLTTLLVFYYAQHVLSASTANCSVCKDSWYTTFYDFMIKMP